ncbi:anti-sigma factor domain-containing protein [Streptomyces sp. TLI_171]|uniref:anti-sigma factor n=1 Tax=Streptomyces sp. TLI_171 TaxID=1938859 RepID=UPI000C18CED9|nr:anti-sigma factor [Streptomyces sp. TLI_171]RKE17976.1 putative zinc finger protein [Streptomyces sp. TLI_171]
MNDTADLHTLTGAYAAHALDDTERTAFERHLGHCPPCTQEVAEFVATLARLGAAEAIAPPPRLKSQVMAAVPRTRQDAPQIASASPPRPGSRLPRRRQGFALAACLALAVGAGAIAIQQHQETERARTDAAAARHQQATLTTLLTAPDAHLATGPVTGGGTGTTVWSPALDQAGFWASGLPALPGDRVYQLWFDDAGTMRPAGLLPPDGTLVLTGRVHPASGVGVTAEPAGGSTHPTGSPLLLLPLI